MIATGLLRLIVLFAAAAVAGTAGTAEPGGPPAWRDDFEGEPPRDWQAYGSACTAAVTAEIRHSGSHALQARFDDSSDVAWANKGVRIEFRPGLAWSQFRYLFLYYHLDRPASVVGYFLHDRAGNWWRAATPDPAAGQWTPAAVSAGVFGFAWNDDPNLPPATKDAEIVELFLFAGAVAVNTGTRYTLTVDDVAFCSSLPEGVEAPAPAAPSPPPALPPEEGEPFALQWRVAQMDRRGYLLVDGKPFFPLGLYSCLGIDQASGAHAESRYAGPVTEAKVNGWLRAMKEAGFNLLQTYTMQFYGTRLAPNLTRAWQPVDVLTPTTAEKLREGTAKLLDLCQAHGLKLMAGCAPPYCAAVLPTDQAKRAAALAAWQEQVRANVLAWKPHPSLLCWYLTDEPSSVAFPVRDLVEQYRFLKRLDGEHPFLIASCAVSDTQYARAVDIIAPDPYPVETGVPFRELPARLRQLQALAVGTPPMPQTWAVIQICQWVEGRRLPSEAEIRLQALTALSQGVTGLLFYEFRNYLDANPEHWAGIGRAVRSLQSVIPALLAPGEVRHDVPVSDRRVYCLAKRVGSGAGALLWLIAANPSQNLAAEPMALGRVTFTLQDVAIGPGVTAVAMDEDEPGHFCPGAQRTVPLEPAPVGCTLSDDFGPLAAHVYRIDMSPR